MSLLFTMTSVGVAMGLTALTGAAAVVEAFSLHHCGDKEIDPIETRFADGMLLRQALEAHGFEVQEVGDSLVVVTPVGSLEFALRAETGSYWVRAYDLVDERDLAAALGGVSETYLQGVQRSNYVTLMERVAARDDVSVVSEEILEDDTIVVTIEV